jgi:hypothetical protein
VVTVVDVPSRDLAAGFIAVGTVRVESSGSTVVILPSVLRKKP